MGDKYSATNYGLPAKKGVDAGTKASLERTAGDKHAIAVNSFADLQRGTVTADPREGPMNPAQDPSKLVTPGEHDLAAGIPSQEAERAAAGADKDASDKS